MHTSRCAIKRPSSEALTARFLARTRGDSHHPYKGGLTPPFSDLIKHGQDLRAFVHRVRFAFAPIQMTWRLLNYGIKQRDYSVFGKTGLVRSLPLARGELHYEHHALHNIPAWQQVWALPRLNEVVLTLTRRHYQKQSDKTIARQVLTHLCRGSLRESKWTGLLGV